MYKKKTFHNGKMKKKTFIVTVMPFLSGKLNSNKAYHKYVTIYNTQDLIFPFFLCACTHNKNVTYLEMEICRKIKAHVEILSCESNDLMDFMLNDL